MGRGDRPQRQQQPHKTRARIQTRERERERERESTRAFRNGAIATEREKERLVPIDSPGTNTKLLARI